MNKTLQIVIGIAVIIIVIATSYYFFIFLPKAQKSETEVEQQVLKQQVVEKQVVEEQDLLENQIKCQQEGTKLYEKDKQELKEDTLFYGYYIDEEFKFNKELNTCLYKVRNWVALSGTDSMYEYCTIKDVYTNKEIFKWSRIWNEKNKEWKDGISNEAEWNKKYNELFRN